MDLKVCTNCGIEKQITEFSTNGTNRPGYRTECKLCRSRKEILRQQTPEGKEKYHDRHREYRARLKLEVFSRYSNTEIVGCSCCGEQYIEFLAIDHINGNGNTHRREIGIPGGYGFYLWLKSNKYPEGYRILCHNCNMSIGIFGYCPHDRPVKGASANIIEKYTIKD